MSGKALTGFDQIPSGDDQDSILKPKGAQHA